ncbi:3D domain-containing protein [Neopoerus faecalis]|uniref:3D domain-containing protein n=1 Tax=Neopoerus faecalis TaxID=3032125 RepID=UPI0025707058|nr:3D domain-containing protein [Neopoerus faecalis]
MSQRSEKLHRQVSQLRADVDALQVAWLAQEHHAATELEASAERARQAHRRARAAQESARAWKLNAILALILAALIAGVALVISAKAAEKPTTPPSSAITDNGQLSGDDTPAQEPLRLDQAHVLENVTVTHYCICQRCCGKAPDHPAYGITASGRRATPYVSVAVDPSVIPLGADVLVDYGDGEIHYYRADDTGSGVGSRHIDLCVGSHAEALQMGHRTATVYWVAQEVE